MTTKQPRESTRSKGKRDKAAAEPVDEAAALALELERPRTSLDDFFVSDEEREQLGETYIGDVFEGRAIGSRDIVELLAFWVAEEEYAVDIVEIQEIIKVPPVTHVPRSPAAVIGVISLRGTIVPVLDLRAVLKLGRVPESGANRILVMRAEGDPVGLLVDRVTSVVRLRRDAIESVPRTMQHDATEYLRGVGRIDERLLILLDLNTVVGVME